MEVVEWGWECEHRGVSEEYGGGCSEGGSGWVEVAG